MFDRDVNMYLECDILFQYFVMKKFATDKAYSPNCPADFKLPLHNVYMLYGLWVIEKNMGTFFQGELVYLVSPSFQTKLPKFGS